MDDVDIDFIEDSGNTAIIDSGNTSTSTTENTLGVAVGDSFNDDNSINDSGNLEVDVEDSFNEDSHDLDVEIEDSFNDESDNSTDNSIDDSYNDFSDHIIEDSYNTLEFSSVDDHSINAGNREYNTGFGDITFGGGMGAASMAAAGGGAVHVQNEATIIDQSSSGNILAGGDVAGFSANFAVTASGEDSMAAGDDIVHTMSIDNSTNIGSLGGDVNVNNDTSITTVIGSFNTYEDNSAYEETDIDVDIEDSWNDYSDTISVTDSFNESTETTSELFVDVNVDAIVDSDDALIADDIDLSF